MNEPINIPLWLVHAKEELGTKEAPGSLNNEHILEFAREARIPNYTADSIPWCAVFACAMLERSGVPSPRSAWARSFLKWGRPCAPHPGCVVVLSRGETSGHVGFLVDQRPGHIAILGGNQGNRVSVVWFSTDRVLGYREPGNVHHQAPTPEVVPAPPPPPPAREEVPTSWPAVVTRPDPKHVEQHLRSRGSRTIRNADEGEWWFKGIGGTAGAFGSLKILSAVAAAFATFWHELEPALAAVNSALDWAWSHAWVIVIVAAAVGVYHMRNIRAARVDDAIRGDNIARLK